MRTETRAVQPDPSDEVSLPADAGSPPTARRMPYKSVLAALVIGVLTVGAQGLLVVGEESVPVNETSEPLPGNPVEPEAMPGEMAHVQTDQDIASIDQTLTSLSDQTRPAVRDPPGHCRGRAPYVVGPGGTDTDDGCDDRRPREKQPEPVSTSE